MQLYATGNFEFLIKEIFSFLFFSKLQFLEASQRISRCWHVAQYKTEMTTTFFIHFFGRKEKKYNNNSRLRLINYLSAPCQNEISGSGS